MNAFEINQLLGCNGWKIYKKKNGVRYYEHPVHGVMKEWEAVKRVKKEKAKAQ